MDDFVNQLNQNNPEASYSFNGNTITGTWSTSASASGTLGTDKIHLDYSIIVNLNPDKTFSYHENMQSANSNSGLDSSVGGPTGDPLGEAFGEQPQQSDGGINIFSSSGGSFSGKTFGQKQKGFSMQFGGKPGQNSYSYDFDASKIKQPLLQSLLASGYTEQKKSLLKSLFGK